MFENYTLLNSPGQRRNHNGNLKTYEVPLKQYWEESL